MIRTINRISIIIYLVLFSHIYSQNSNVVNNYKFDFQDQPLRLALKQISRETGLNFIYKDELVDNRNISGMFSYTNKDVFIKRLFSYHDIGYKSYGDNNYVLYRVIKQKAKKVNENIIEEGALSSEDSSYTITEPKLIIETDPYYPAEAVRKGIEGEVTVRMFVNKEGKVSLSGIEKTSGHEILDSAALAYSNQLHFIPAQTNGNPRNVWSIMVFKYSIKGE